MTLVVPFTFAAAARQLAERGWRPFPGIADQQDASNAGLVWPQ